MRPYYDRLKQKRWYADRLSRAEVSDEESAGD